jgi:hypothetical protein
MCLYSTRLDYNKIQIKLKENMIMIVIVALDN